MAEQPVGMETVVTSRIPLGGGHNEDKIVHGICKVCGHRAARYIRHISTKTEKDNLN